jgi:hypothetical protein
MVLRNSLLGADITEYVQLPLVFSTHAFFLPASSVETYKVSATASQCEQFLSTAQKQQPLELGEISA